VPVPPGAAAAAARHVLCISGRSADISHLRVCGEETMTRRIQGALAAALVAIVVAGCASLEQALRVQPPSFSVLSDRPAELRLLGPSMDRPTGGAAIRLWARVENPNAVAISLTRFAGNLFLDGTRAVDLDFPLGVPLPAVGDTIVPLDVNLSFSDVPALADVALRMIGRNNVAYRLDGTFGVDAGVLGQPSFGPNTWLAGDMRVFR
jgi:hypothetical protein